MGSVTLAAVYKRFPAFASLSLMRAVFLSIMRHSRYVLLQCTHTSRLMRSKSAGKILYPIENRHKPCLHSSSFRILPMLVFQEREIDRSIFLISCASVHCVCSLSRLAREWWIVGKKNAGKGCHVIHLFVTSVLNCFRLNLSPVLRTDFYYRVLFSLAVIVRRLGEEYKMLAAIRLLVAVCATLSYSM